MEFSVKIRSDSNNFPLLIPLAPRLILLRFVYDRNFEERNEEVR